MVVGVLAASLAGLVTTTAEAQTVQVSGNEAFYMAESGARYAIAQLRADGMDALPELDGKTFTLDNGWGFELGVTYSDTGSTYIFDISSVGFTAGGDTSRRQSLNGYQVEIPKYSESLDMPVSMRYGMELLSDSSLSISGSAYIDSYDSMEEGMEWTTPGGFSDAVVRVAGGDDVLRMSWSTKVYGSVSVPEGTDISDPSEIVNRPQNVLGDPKIVAESGSTREVVPVPEEPAEAPAPVSWDPLPSFQTWGSDSIPGGNYSISRDFSPSNAALTATDSLALEVGRDFHLSGSGSLAVDGDLAAWIDRDMKLSGGGSGLNIEGNADIQVGRKFEISGSQTMVVDGDLDLDVDGSFSIAGDGTLHVKGDAYIDVADGFSISGSGKLIVEGKVIIHSSDGLSLTGSAYPLQFGENGAVQAYVDSGKITISSSVISDPYSPTQFMVFGGEDVSSLSINGSGQVAGALYVPFSEFSIHGSSQLFGAVVADSVKSFAGGTSIHQDKALARSTPAVDLEEQPLRRYWILAGGG